MIEYYVGSYEQDYDDVVELCGTWWYDSLFYKTYSCDYRVYKEMFKQAAASGQLLPLCGRDTETGKLVACYIATITPYMYNPSLLMSTELVWCLHEDYRKGKEVFKLIKAIEIVLKAYGVYMYNLNLSCDKSYDALGEYLVNKKDFVLMDKVYSKVLGDTNG